MKPSSMTPAAAATLSVLILAACSTPVPQAPSPSVPLAATFSHEQPATAAAAALDDTWWVDFGDATLVSYDSVGRSATRVGQLPGSAEFGGDVVFANVVAGPTAPAAGFASRSISGVVQASGTRVFTFDPATAGSLRNTTRQQ